MRRTLIGVVAAGLIAAPSSAEAAWQPYGGCDEAWQAPRSAGARDCRDHGWIVRKWVVLTPPIRGTRQFRYLRSTSDTWLCRSPHQSIVGRHGCVWFGPADHLVKMHTHDGPRTIRVAG